MNDSKISVRYAKALFQTAVQKQVQLQVKDDMLLLLDCIKNVSEFKALLDSPVITNKDKVDTFKKLFGSKLNQLTVDFFNLLVENKRENFLKLICLNYTGFYNQHNNIKKVSVTTAVEPPSLLLADIANKVGMAYPSSKIDLSAQTDPSIIGGLVITIDDRRYDASVRTQLANYKDKLITNK